MSNALVDSLCNREDVHSNVVAALDAQVDEEAKLRYLAERRELVQIERKRALDQTASAKELAPKFQRAVAVETFETTDLEPPSAKNRLTVATAVAAHHIKVACQEAYPKHGDKANLAKLVEGPAKFMFLND
eukprot:2423292-Amphidinium_carterae.1